MVAIVTPSQVKRLSLQVEKIGADTTTIRSLDWERDRFDIEFGLQNGTTYNSFLIQGDKTALVDTSHAKFRELYLPQIQTLIDLTQLDYLIISHTEPDHSGLVRDILALAPQVTVVGSKVALQFLDNFIHVPYQRMQVKQGDTIDLGRGHVLEFINAPNLHWPDTILTWDQGSQILFTCDVFGMHYCRETLYDDSLTEIEADFRYYYDCLMGPNARSVLAALKRMAPLGQPQVIATGHGPLLRHYIPDWLSRYQDWSQDQSKSDKTIAVFYIADYGDSDRLSQAVAHGANKAGATVEMVDMKTADLQEVRELVERSQGLVVGLPPVTGDFASHLRAVVSTILGSVQSKQRVGLFESGGGDDESIHVLAAKFRDLGLSGAFPALRWEGSPTPATYQRAEEAGTDLGQWVNRDRAIQQMKALDNDLDRALGRLSGGLYIITAEQEQRSGAMLASWVTQASFQPLGLTIAVAKDRAIESLMQVGDSFVLNVLEAAHYQHLMKHFLKRFGPGDDRFAGVKTQPAKNGSPILTEALAYLECTVATRMECSDHWIIYATVDTGRVAKPEGLTAVHHRKVGNHY
ncbi:putative flavoprotein [Gloeomargarita lithophora Alchichica-D10]|uniref:Putative flavoprotein n=1 Tax=Gloeomargarita lithophora Alchichica-D10 TaxID=1188229 RepID=A0A1J0AEA8_9CYAN|nr:diflavin flavoprotein [Gloeomargarita lithophora]APB34274.1 putative flavoprotein [Gloeomargarita lithophora Alchichica-D10]